MRLDELIAAVEGHRAFAGLEIAGGEGEPVSVDLTEAVADSRRVRAGSLFCCVVGATHDGHDHAAAAVEAGAAALLCERPLGLGVPEMIVTSTRAAMGEAAAVLAGRPSAHLDVIGITGTNGKTTTAYLLSSILNAAGRSCAVIGTLSGVRTTPEATELSASLAALVAEGRDSVALEVSSHALDLHRIDGTRVRIAVFTNLSRDHLDHHGDMAAYFQAKARLFEPDLSDRAVVNLDDPHGRLLADVGLIPTVGYRMDDAEDLITRVDGSRFRWRGVEIALPIAGRFNVSNALAAATVAAELGVGLDAISAGLGDIPPVPGRFERIDRGQGFLAVVDYAHTPDGLEELLSSARELIGAGPLPGRVLVVFGAGGDRDPDKRPAMGEVVARLADVAFLTSDNPRSESPAAIIEQVSTGMIRARDLHVEPDRRRAIARAVGMARTGDVVVVAGKGHETTQTIGEVVEPFDDRVELARAIEGLTP